MMDRITEHDRLPTWRGTLSSPTLEGYARNPLCGDEVWVELMIKEKVIRQIRFHGQGCVVSQACASMLCEGLEGKAVKQVLGVKPEELMEFEIRALTLNRRRCALVVYEALLRALEGSAATSISVGELDSCGETSTSNDGQRPVNFKPARPH